MPRVEPVYEYERRELGPEGYMFVCPGCGLNHEPLVRKRARPPEDNPVWTFNGDLERPTFSPSILVRWEGPGPENVKRVCHSFVRDGRIQFLNDCTHDLAGQTVDLPDVD